MRTITAVIIVSIALSPALALGKVGGGDIVFRPAGAGVVTYSHDSHIGRSGLKCSECHPKLFAMSPGYGKTKMANMEAGQSCGACHNGVKAFSVKVAAHCVKCHEQ